MAARIFEALRQLLVRLGLKRRNHFGFRQQRIAKTQLRQRR
jgi:hypothetical protein